MCLMVCIECEQKVMRLECPLFIDHFQICNSIHVASSPGHFQLFHITREKREGVVSEVT